MLFVDRPDKQYKGIGWVYRCGLTSLGIKVERACEFLF